MARDPRKDGDDQHQREEDAQRRKQEPSTSRDGRESGRAVCVRRDNASSSGDADLHVQVVEHQHQQRHQRYPRHLVDHVHYINDEICADSFIYSSVKLTHFYVNNCYVGEIYLLKKS